MHLWQRLYCGCKPANHSGVNTAAQLHDNTSSATSKIVGWRSNGDKCREILVEGIAMCCDITDKERSTADRWARDANQDTLRELSAPILPVLPGVLVAPLIGTIDSRRAIVFMNNVLTMVAQEQARYIIFDVTGVPIVDTQVAQVLLQTANAARLLGAQVLLVGIRPEVAQTLVALNIRFDTFTAYVDLREAVIALMHSTE